MKLDKWIEIAKECKYLPENDLRKLCDLVCDLLLEESNIQPISTPVVVKINIYFQFEHFLFNFFFFLLGLRRYSRTVL